MNLLQILIHFDIEFRILISISYQICHKFWYNPLYGQTITFLFLYQDLSEPIPDWYYNWTWYFTKTAWVDALLWIFLVVPITVFTYWLYEPVRLQWYRIRFYRFVEQKLFGAKHSEIEINVEHCTQINVEQPPGSNDV